MEKMILNTMNYPPPPPPPPQASSKRSSKTLVVALVIVLVVAGVVGAYYLTTLPLNNDNGPSTSLSASVSPSGSHSSASPTSPPSATTSPSPSEQTASGYRLGAWSNYIIENFNSIGSVVALYDLGYSVDEVTYKGVDCWLLITERSLSMMNSTTKTITTYWLDKSNLQGVHYRIQIYSNGMVISDTGDDYYENSVNDIPTAIDPNIVISQESITVPAGTFNCDKTVATMTDLGNTYVTTTWGNSNVPVVGMIKQEMTANGILISRTELVSYGG